jgi:hypothetical protein
MIFNLKVCESFALHVMGYTGHVSDLHFPVRMVILRPTNSNVLNICISPANNVFGFVCFLR